MKVLLLTAHTIINLGEKYAGAKKYCDRFLIIMRFADIHKPDDFIKAFRGNLISGKIVLEKGQKPETVNRVVFDFGGNGNNSYRVICHYQIGNSFARLYVKWAGSHEEYNHLSEEFKLKVGYRK